MRSRPLNAGAVVVAAALLLSGCSADNMSIVVLSARSAGDKCDFSDNTKYASRGSLDLTPYFTVDPVANPTATPSVTAGYYQVFSWENNLQTVPLSVNGQVIDPGTGNDFVADTVVYEYQYSDTSVALSPETANMHAIITAGATPDNNSVPTDLIQPKAFAAINGSTAIDSANQTLLVTFQIFGKLLAGGSTKSTNKVTFPLTIYRKSKTAVNCFGLTPAESLNGGACNVPGRDQDVSCKLSSP